MPCDLFHLSRLYPPGGFVNSLRMSFPYATYPNGSQLPENSHFVGCISNKGTPSPTNDKGTPIAEVHDSIDIDADDTLEPARTDKRLNWSHEEDVRLVSLLSSMLVIQHVDQCFINMIM
jgi:hypothetical protein